MFSGQHTKFFVTAWVATSLLLLASLTNRLACAQDGQATNEATNMTVVVNESDTGEPISQAHITLEFQEARAHRRPQKIAYSAKTDTQGRCKLTGIYKGPIVLTVTAPGHQSYGKELQLEKDNQVFEVKLKKPQPLI